MFDKLIESDTTGADFKSRRRYFIASSLFVGAAFIAAVIVSIYAAEIGLGADAFELSAIIAPVHPPEIAPEPPEPQRNRSNSASQDQVPQRVALIRRIDEPPQDVPPISVTPNTIPQRPFGDNKISTQNVDPGIFTPKGNPNGTGASNDVPMSSNSRATSTIDVQPEPPPLVPSRPKHIGVVNGIAKYLPKPPYPQAALFLGIQGKVDVQVVIDETGKVVSAKAVSGHVTLKTAAEQAARNARFSPTLLNNVPVKVTGVIVYNFTRN
jgi:TonB family protein